MYLQTLLKASIAIFILSPLAAALSPGTYFFQNVFFSGRRAFSGQSPGVALPGEGYPVTTSLPQAVTDKVLSNHIFTIDSTMTTMLHEESQQFAVVDASDGGSAGSGIILSNSLFPSAPFNPIGNSDWTFVQAAEGMMIVLFGRNLAWSLQTAGFGTQITIQPINASDLRQQWTFVAHALV